MGISVVVLLGLFGSPVAPADRPIAEVTSEDRAASAVPDVPPIEEDACEHIGPDYIKCQHAPSCRWDVEEARCEPVYGSHCASFSFPGACNAHPDCLWDSFDALCEHI